MENDETQVTIKAIQEQLLKNKDMLLFFGNGDYVENDLKCIAIMMSYNYIFNNDKNLKLDEYLDNNSEEIIQSYYGERKEGI